MSARVIYMQAGFWKELRADDSIAGFQSLIKIFEAISEANLRTDIEDVDWVRKILESQLAGSFVEKMKGVLETVTDGSEPKDIAKQIYDLVITGITHK